MKKLISSEIARCQIATLRKKLSHILLDVFMYILFILSEPSMITFFKESLKVCEQILFQEI